jgi:Cu-processing system permease protein
MGQSLGLSLAIGTTFILGVGIPFMSYGLFESAEIFNFLTLILSGFLLAIIFTSLAYMISIHNSDKVRGIGISLMVWLFMSVIYDGLFLIYLMVMSEYPVEKHAIVISLFNPIDLARVATMLKLDIAALLGYTGAVFKNFFGSGSGLVITGLTMLLWSVIPFLFIARKGNKKDF